MRVISGFPLLALVLIAYAVIAFGNSFSLDQTVMEQAMLSGAVLRVSVAEILLFTGLFLLFVEVIKSARAGTSTIIDHMLSTAVFIAGLVAFLLLPQTGTTVFLLLVAMCFIDVVAGYTITIKSARRDVNLGNDIGGF